MPVGSSEVEALARTLVHQQSGGTDVGRRVRRWSLAALVLATVVLAGTWARASTPRLVTGSSWGVFSDDHPVLEVTSYTGPDLVVLPAASDGTSTVLLTLRNEGPIAVTLLDVWPEDTEHGCAWGPVERRVRTDPQTMLTGDGPAAPVRGAVVEPGGEVAVWLDGVMNDASCSSEALTSVPVVPVDVRVLGRATRVDVALEEFRLGWTDDLEGHAERDLTTLTPPE